MAYSHVNHFSEFAYHITGRNSNREAFRLDMSDVWNILSEQLFLAHHIYGLRITAVRFAASRVNAISVLLRWFKEPVATFPALKTIDDI